MNRIKRALALLLSLALCFSLLDFTAFADGTSDETVSIVVADAKNAADASEATAPADGEAAAPTESQSETTPSDGSEEVPDIELSSPSLVSAANSASGVTVKWDAVDGADSYNVYRKVSGKGWKRLTSVTDTAYTDTSAASGTTYYYTVRAVSGTTLSSYDTAGLSILCLAQPAVTVSNASGGVTIKWNAVDGAQGYYVCRKTAGSSWSMLKGTTATSYTDTTAASGTTYYYTVRAKSGSTLSSYTSDVSIAYLAQPVITTANSTSGIKISWSAITGASKYRIYRRTSGGSYSKLTDVTDTYYYDESVNAGTAYAYVVKAISDSATSANSASAAIRRLETPSVSALAYQETITVSWDSVTGATGYNIYRRTSDSSWSKIGSVSGNSTVEYEDSNASWETLYYYTVRAYAGTSSSSFDATGADAILMYAPSLTISAGDDDFENTLNWDSVSGANGYQIYYKIGSDGSWSKLTTVNGSVTEYTTSVTHGKYYYYKVRAIRVSSNGSSVGKFSDEESAIQYYYPQLSFGMSDKTNNSCGAIAICVKNNGVGTIRFYADAYFSDNDDDKSYDRDLIMYDYDTYQNSGTLKKISYMDISAGSTAYLLFGVDGSKTRYTTDSTVFVLAYYDGINYDLAFTKDYGFAFYDLDYGSEWVFVG